MDQNELQKNIALYYSKLPPKAQEVFSKMEWLDTLQKIATKYGLNDAQKQKLATETTLLLLGITNIIGYEETLITDLNLLQDSTDGILTEVKTSILETILPELNETFTKNIKEGEENSPDLTTNLDARFNKLPPEVEKIVKEFNYQGIIFTIGKDYGLNITQMGILEKATTDLILGVLHPDNFEDMIEDKLNLTIDKKLALVNDINEKIFKKIREQVMGLEKPQPQGTPIPVTTPKPQIQKGDMAVLNKAGINIIDNDKNTPNLETLELASPDKLKEKVLPILEQKLSGSVQNEVKETEHFTSDIGKKLEKDTSINPTIISTPETPTPAPQAPSYAKGADPYRLPPE